MATVLTISGSPSAASRTARLLRHLGDALSGRGHDVEHLDVRSIPAEALLGADFAHPALVHAKELVEGADGVVVGTPVYKAAYSGALKCLLDLLPQYALTGKSVLPVATGGSFAHVLAIDYALRPVLTSLGADRVAQGRFVLDRHISVAEDGVVTVAPEAAEGLGEALGRFAGALAGSRPELVAA